MTSSYINFGKGAEFSLKVGRVLEIDDVANLKNVLFGIRNFLNLIKEMGLVNANVRRIYLKTEKSESLPIYTFLTKNERLLAR